MELKLLYVLTSAGLQSDSVQKKVIAQINALNACGVKCRGAFFTSDVQVETSFNEHIVLIPYPFSNKKYFNGIYQKIKLINMVSEYLSKTIIPGEYIYLRYPGVTYELFKFAKKFKNRIISEHQGKEIDEIKSFKEEHPLGFNFNKLISYFIYQFWPIANEKIWSRLYSNKLKAKVAVTYEIAEYHKKYCKNVWVIPNGIETKNYKIRTVPELNNELRILFLKGTSGLAEWNGLDRLIKSIDLYYSNGTAIQLTICGNIIPGEVPERNYIIHKGYQNNEELDKIFSTVHIGFSTLCLFRKNLNEASVLKAREYFARGLPFVYGYTDPDIQKDDPINKFLLRIPNNDSIINFDEVVAFAQNICSDNSHPHKLRQFSENKLDWKVKMNLLKKYLL